MLLPSVHDNERIQEEFDYIFQGSGTLTGLTSIGDNEIIFSYMIPLNEVLISFEVELKRCE